MQKKSTIIAGYTIVVLLRYFFLTNFQFTPWPELQLWPYLMDHGFRLYEDIAFEKPPLLPLVLQYYFNLFGNSLGSLKSLALITHFATDSLLYWIILKSRRSPIFATASCLAYIIISTAFGGNTVWFDTLLTPIFIVTYLLAKAGKSFWTGVLFSISILVKQTSLVLLLPISLQVKNRIISLKMFSIGAVIPLAVVTVWALAATNIQSVIQWNLAFTPYITTLSQISPPPKFLFTILVLLLPTILIAQKDILLTLFAISSVTFVFPRFETFHLQPLLPFVLLALTAKKHILENIALLTTCVFLHFYSVREFSKFHAPDRFYEESTLAVAAWVKSHTHPLEKIYVLNTWDNIYVLSNTLPATKPWFHYLPWYLAFPGTEESILEDLKHEMPRYIVSAGLVELPANTIENYVRNYYFPAIFLNNKYTIWTRR